MRSCVIIPVHNEAKEIGGLIARVKAKGLDVVVVNDGSCDGSGRIASECGAHVMHNERKRGKGFSLQKGFAYCLAQDYAGVITMDGDGQHDAEDLDKFIQQVAVSPDTVIVGSRMGNKGQMPLVRRLTNQFMSSLISSICGQSIPDTQCGYRYISRKVLENIKLGARDFEIETEVLIKASKKGYKILSVPIRTIYRDEVSKINPVIDTFRFFRYLFKELLDKK